MREKKTPLRWKRRPLPLQGFFLRRGDTVLALVTPADNNTWTWECAGEIGGLYVSEDRAKGAALAAARRRGW